MKHALGTLITDLVGFIVINQSRVIQAIDQMVCKASLVIASYLPAQARAYGSHVSGLDTHLSDLDVVITGVIAPHMFYRGVYTYELAIK